MAFSASALSDPYNKAWSWGPVKLEIQRFSAVSSDTSGTATAKSLHQVDQVLLVAEGSVCQTSAPSISGLTATFAFADPASACTGYSAANINGFVIFIGK